MNTQNVEKNVVIEASPVPSFPTPPQPFLLSESPVGLLDYLLRPYSAPTLPDPEAGEPFALAGAETLWAPEVR